MTSFYVLSATLAFAIALLVVTLIHPQVVKFAKKRNIVDNPDARKLQRNPVPVMGGVAVFFGIISGFAVATFLLDTTNTLTLFV